MKKLLLLLLLTCGIASAQQSLTYTRYGDQSRIYQLVQGDYNYTGYQYNGTPSVYSASTRGIYRTRIIKDAGVITIGTASYKIAGGDLGFDDQYASATGHGIWTDNNGNSLTASVTTRNVYSIASSEHKSFRTDTARDGFFTGSESSLESQIFAIARNNRGTTFNSYRTTVDQVQVDGIWYLYQLDRDNIQQTQWTRTDEITPEYSFIGNDLNIRRIRRNPNNADLLEIWIQDPDVNEGPPYEDIVSDLQDADDINSQIAFRYDERRNRRGCGGDGSDCYTLFPSSISYTGYTTDGSSPERVEAIIVTLNTSAWGPGISNSRFLWDTLYPITDNVWGNGTQWIQDWSVIVLEIR